MSSTKDGNSGLPAIDAFCGAGGLSCGLIRAGIQILSAFDIDDDSIATYRKSVGDHAFVSDVRHVSGSRLLRHLKKSPGEITLVAGGPPCQGFSVQRRNGEFDVRNSLPLEFLRLINEVQPALFLFENVPGIRNRHGKQILEAFVTAAAAAGYVCQASVLDAVNFGVPQYRRRLFVIGERSHDGKTWFRFPDATSDENADEVKVCFALRGLPTPPDDFTEHPDYRHHRRTRLSVENRKRLALIPQGGGMMDLPPELRVNCHRNGPDRIGHRFVYGRLHWERPASTITARFDSFTRGKFAHPLEDRNISLREGARFQTFPDDFVFVGAQESIAAQIGNAVPPRLAEVLGRAIVEATLRRSAGESPVRTVTKLMEPLLFA